MQHLEFNEPLAPQLLHQVTESSGFDISASIYGPCFDLVQRIAHTLKVLSLRYVDWGAAVAGLNGLTSLRRLATLELHDNDVQSLHQLNPLARLVRD